MPWLHLIFDAWEDHRRQRAREDEERARQELLESELSADIDPLDDDNDRGKKKKRKGGKRKK
jgi:hypothetical protein